MAVRTSADAVKEIMDNCTLDNSIVNAYVKAANLVVDNAFAGDTTVSSALLAEIERWFAAHMIASTRWRVAKREKLGDGEVEYTGKFGEDLSSTPYGQMIKVIDTTGKMSKLGKKAVSIYTVTSFED